MRTAVGVTTTTTTKQQTRRALVIAAGRMRGRLDRGALRRALACVVARHDALRSRIAAMPGGAGAPRHVQIVTPAARFALPLTELAAADASGALAALQAAYDALPNDPLQVRGRDQK